MKVKIPSVSSYPHRLLFWVNTQVLMFSTKRLLVRGGRRHVPCVQGRIITGYHSSCQVWMMLEGPCPVVVPALALRLRSGYRLKYSLYFEFRIPTPSPKIFKAMILAPSGIPPLRLPAPHVNGCQLWLPQPVLPRAVMYRVLTAGAQHPS